MVVITAVVVIVSANKKSSFVELMTYLKTLVGMIVIICGLTLSICIYEQAKSSSV